MIREPGCKCHLEIGDSPCPVHPECVICGSAGSWSDFCPGCGAPPVSPFSVRELATLASNLAIAGALFVAFRAGDNFGFHMGDDQSQCTCQWSPGRGEPYAGATRCEQDEVLEEYWAEREAELDGGYDP